MSKSLLNELKINNAEALNRDISELEINFQLDACIEDLSSLIYSIARHKKIINGGCAIETVEEARMEIHESIGDVVISLERLLEIYDCANQVQRIIDEKLDDGLIVKGSDIFVEEE